MGNCSNGVSFATTDQHTSAIFESILSNDVILLEKLIMEKRPTRNMFNDDGYTPLHLATELGNEECVKILVLHGSDVNAGDRMEIAAIGGPYHLRPIHLAVSNGWYNIVKILLTHHAKPNIKTAIGWTPLHDVMANDIINDCHLNCMELLIESGADINIKDADGRIPLDAAVIHGHYSATRMLLNYGSKYHKMSHNLDPDLLKPRGDRGERIYACANMCLLAGCGKLVDNYQSLKANFDDPDCDTPFVINQMDKLIKLHTGIKSLKQLCRLAIRRERYGCVLMPFVNAMFIPNELKDYLLLVQL